MTAVEQRPRAGRIVLIGGGVANASFLISLNRWLDGPGRSGIGLPQALRVTVVDRDGEYGGGLAYRGSTGPSLLMNDPAGKIDSSAIGFCPWLVRRADAWQAALREDQRAWDDERVGRWLREHEQSVRSGEVEGLYVPRSVFGMFIREAFADACRALAAHPQSRVHVETIAAEAVDVLRTARAPLSVCLDRAPYRLPADAVVLGIGSVRRGPEPAFADGPGFFDDLFGHDVREVADELAAILGRTPPGGRRVALLGAAATTVELLHGIATTPALLDLVDEAIVVAPRGILPGGLPSDPEREPFDFPALGALTAPGTHRPDADRLLEAVMADLAASRALGFTIIDVTPGLQERFRVLFGRLPDPEKKRFVAHRSRVMRALTRRTSPAYARSLDDLSRRGILTLLRGRAHAARRAADGMFLLELGGLADPAGARTQQLRAAAVFDCRGFGDLGACRDPLMENLMAGGLIRANDGRQGIAVDDRLEAADGVFVHGAMLVGHSEGADHFWHLDSVGWIHTMAARLVPDVLERLTSPVPESPAPAVPSPAPTPQIAGSR